MSSGFGGLLRTLIFVLIFAIVLTTITNMLLNPSSIVEVTECLLTSDTVNSGGQTSISITLKNTDNENAHKVRIEFSSHHLVRFLLGATELLKKDGIWYHEESLNPDSSYNQLINVRPTLEEGISKLDYRIVVVCFLDGKQFYQKNLDLTVQLP